MDMDTRTFLKLGSCTITLIVLFFGTIIFFAWLLNSLLGIILGVAIAMIIFVLFVEYVYPLLFKEYIKEFWRKQDEKT